MVFIFVISAVLALAFGQGITQPGTGCGTWRIGSADCSAVSASQYWNFNVTFTVQSQWTTLEIAVIYNPITWGLYDANGCITGSTSSACGTFSSLTPCPYASCDPSLGQVCSATAINASPGTQVRALPEMKKMTVSGLACPRFCPVLSTKKIRNRNEIGHANTLHSL
jgi:hypothetical protein